MGESEAVQGKVILWGMKKDATTYPPALDGGSQSACSRCIIFVSASSLCAKTRWRVKFTGDSNCALRGLARQRASRPSSSRARAAPRRLRRHRTARPMLRKGSSRRCANRQRGQDLRRSQSSSVQRPSKWQLSFICAIAPWQWEGLERGVPSFDAATFGHAAFIGGRMALMRRQRPPQACQNHAAKASSAQEDVHGDRNRSATVAGASSTVHPR